MKTFDINMKNEFGADYDFPLSFDNFGRHIPSWYTLKEPPLDHDVVQITVAIPNYNRAPLLDSLVRSILWQSLPKEMFEIIIVDDASEDKSIKVLKDICGRYSDYNIRVYPLEHTRTYSPSHPWNVATRYAIGNVVMLVQPDLVMVDKDTLGSALRLHHWIDKLILCPFLVSIRGDEVGVEAEVAISNDMFIDIPLFCGTCIASDQDTLRRFNCPFPSPNGMSLRAEYLRRLHGFDERILTAPPEVDLFGRLMHFGLVFGIENSIKIVNRRFQSKRTNPPFNEVPWSPHEITRNGDDWGLLTDIEKGKAFNTHVYF